MIPQEYIQEVVRRNDIEEVIGQYVQLRRRGRTLSGLCPFHNEKTPSFVVYPDTQSFYCFGCGAAGDVINFVRKYNNLGYVESIKQLAARAGMPLPEEEDREAKARQRLLEINRSAARYFYEQLRMSEDAGQCDLLIADFEDTDAAGRQTEQQNDEVPQIAGETIEDDEESLARRAFAVLLLPRRQTFVHDVRSEQGLAYNDIVRHDSALPNPTQKIDTYAVIDGETLDIAFHDVERSIAGRRMLLVPEGFLSCSTEASGREVIEAVEKLVADVAEEYGIESAVAVSRAKSYVIDRASAADDVTPAEVGREVFQDNPAMAERYEQRLEERAYTDELPARVNVRKGVATRLAKKHRIRTDTGIEVSFPSEYAASSDYIEFGKDETGKITIELKNIGRIENR